MAQLHRSNPLVSIIIPAYNAEQWILDTLASAVGQTYRPIEIIIIDDGSTDRTAEIAERYTIRRESADPYVTFVQQSNSGSSVARNVGLAQARGEYIQFLDADDILDQGKIAFAVDVLERSGDKRALTHCRWDRFTTSLAVRDYREEPCWRDMDPTEFMVNYYTQQPGGMQPVGSWLVPRSLIDRAGPWSTAYRSPIDDGEYLFRLLQHASAMLFEPMALLHYRSGIGGWSTVRTHQTAEAIFQSYVVMVNSLLSREKSNRTRHAAACAFQEYVYRYFGLASRRTIRTAEACVRKYGGPVDIEPEGPPRFHQLRPLVGWKLARRVERLRNQLRF